MQATFSSQETDWKLDYDFVLLGILLSECSIVSYEKMFCVVSVGEFTISLGRLFSLAIVLRTAAICSL